MIGGKKPGSFLQLGSRPVWEKAGFLAHTFLYKRHGILLAAWFTFTFKFTFTSQVANINAQGVIEYV